MTAKLKFYEVVKVVSERAPLREIRGLTGTVVGIIEGEDGHWLYDVSIFDRDETWSVEEPDLKSTGKYLRREDIYEGEAIRILVDPRTGEGSLLD